MASLLAALPAIAAALDSTMTKVVAAAAAALAAGSAAGSGAPVPLDNARSALRLLDALVSRLPAVSLPCREVASLVSKVEGSDVLARLYATVKADRVG